MNDVYEMLNAANIRFLNMVLLHWMRIMAKNHGPSAFLQSNVQ